MNSGQYIVPGMWYCNQTPYEETSFEIAFEHSMVKVTVTKNRIIVSGQSQHWGMRYCYQTWYIASLCGDKAWDCLWALKGKVTTAIKKRKKVSGW